jgi:nitrate reductase gamma subunit
MASPTGLFLFLLAYIMYAAFMIRLFIHGRIWLRETVRHEADPSRPPSESCDIWARTVLDVLFFRRLFASDKILWPGSWLFHLSFFFVLLRHLRYFLEPVPGCVTALQPFGVFAGYVLLLALASVLCIRLFSGKKRYVSYSNYFILSLILLISLSGILMRNFFRPDLLQVKAFSLGILTFSPEALPSGNLFIFHFLLTLLLVPYIPSHIFAAPLVLLDAARREKGLGMIMHEK